MHSFVSLPDLAKLAGISRQAAEKAIAKVLRQEAPIWRGADLVVRQVRGRGGRSGLSYQVRVDSLPLDLQLRWKELQGPLQRPMKLDDAGAVERERRFNIIRPALAFERYSRERGAAIQDIAGRKHLTPAGTAERVSARTVERWLERYEAHGVGGLTRARRSDTGSSKVIVSLAWDKAVPFDLETKEEIAASVRQDLRDLWGNGTSSSAVARLASERLADITRQAGFDPGATALRRLCKLPGQLVASESRYRKVHEFRTDRKAFEDGRGRVKRTIAGLAPMEIVFGDVHHLDVLVTRADGSRATPKAINWLDVGTGRVRTTLVLCDAGRAVRNCDVIDSFIDMALDPHWGLPKFLYLDNGSEYKWADFVGDALTLSRFGVDLHDRTGSIVRAKAYNGPDKSIEGFHGVFERTVLSVLPGYVGGNRMAPRTGKVGRTPVPFPGPFEAFGKVYYGMLDFYNAKEQRGELRGRSPHDLYSRAVEDGWERVTIDEFALRMAFSEPDTRKVTQETISFAGPAGKQRLTCDGLAKVNGETVQILKPKYSRWPGVPVLSKEGEFVGIAVPVESYGYLDKAGAQEAARKSANSKAAIAELAAGVNRIDVAARMTASGQRVTPTPTPPTSAVVGLNGPAAMIGKALDETPADRRDREHKAAQAAQKKQAEYYRKRFGAPR